MKNGEAQPGKRVIGGESAALFMCGGLLFNFTESSQSVFYEYGIIKQVDCGCE